VLLSTAIAFATIGLGKLNLIAPVVSMFFLISYGLLNYATYYEARSASPSFRPRFKYFNKWLSLAGGLACLGAMLAIDLTAGIVAMAILTAIFQYLKRTAGVPRWADSQRSYHVQMIREHLLAAAREPEHPRYWRPQILAFSKASSTRSQLLEFSSWLEGRSGLTTLVRILEGQGLHMLAKKEAAEVELQQDIARNKSQAFPLAIVAPDPPTGIKSLIQSYGIGPLKANTILLNWHEQSPRETISLYDQGLGINLRAAYLQGCNIILLDAKPDKWAALENISAQDLCIDVWWWADATSRLMLLLAYLMTRSERWRHAKIRLLAVVDGDKSRPTMESLQEMLDEVRIEAEPLVIETPDADTIAEYSEESALVFLPCRIRADKVVDPFGGPLESLLFLLPLVAVVLAVEDIELDAEPEEGKAADIATSLDAVQEARKTADKAAKEALEAHEIAEKAKTKTKDLAPGTDEEIKTNLEKESQEAQYDAALAADTAKEAEAKARLAAEEAEANGILTPDEEENESEADK
jgi:hypothetical protein